ncbi:hypothetical protein [Nocardia sp. NPDC004711]
MDAFGSVSARVSEIARSEISRIGLPGDYLHAMANEILSRRRTEAGWWLSDFVDPDQPSLLAGLDERLDADRHRWLAAAAVRSRDWVLALVCERRHDAGSSESAGQLFVALGRPTRGPNFRSSTLISCRTAGLVRLKLLCRTLSRADALEGLAWDIIFLLMPSPECLVFVFVMMSLPVATLAYAVLLVSLFAAPDRAVHARRVLGDVLAALLKWGRRWGRGQADAVSARGAGARGGPGCRGALRFGDQCRFQS